MNKIYVSSGQCSLGLKVGLGDEAFVATGGTVQDAAISIGGKLYLESGAIVEGAVDVRGLISGGYFDGSGSVMTIERGGSSLNQTIKDGAVVNVSGLVNGLVIDGGTINLLTRRGGNSLGFAKNKGGVLNLNNNGIYYASGEDGYALSSRLINVGSRSTYSGGLVGSGGRLTVSGNVDDLKISGGTVELYSNSNSTLNFLPDGGGKLIVEANAYYKPQNSALQINSNCHVEVMGGGALENIYVASGGEVSISGGTLSNSTINGGTIDVYSGSTLGSVSVLGNSLVKVREGSVWDQSPSNGNFTVYEGGTLKSLVLQKGGSAVISSGGKIQETLTVSSGAEVVLNGTAGDGTINLVGGGGKISIVGKEMPNNIISGFNSDDTIDLSSIPRSSIDRVSYENDDIVFHTSDSSYRLHVPGAQNYGYELQTDKNGDTIYTTCFAEGTCILTPQGEVAIELLTEGQVVCTLKGPMPIRWVGYRSLEVKKQKNPEENWLIRVRKSALSNNVPRKDLLITQEHCLFFEGKLVPVRMLVNETNIITDRTISEYKYYHIELEEHAVIWADGALTESYLDTGNRQQFQNVHTTCMFPEIFRKVSYGSKSLPLDTSRVFVEPIYWAIAEQESDSPGRLKYETTENPDLHIVYGNDECIFPVSSCPERYIFSVPSGVSTIILKSRSFRPSEVIGPFVDDRRDLGVKIGKISLLNSNKTTEIKSHISNPSSMGWHNPEGNACWTTGSAHLKLPEGIVKNGPTLLVIQILSSGKYVLTDCLQMWKESI